MLRASSVMLTRRLESKEQEVLLDLRLCRRRRRRSGPRSVVVGRPTHPSIHPSTPHGRLICALDLPSRRACCNAGLSGACHISLIGVPDRSPSGMWPRPRKGSSAVRHREEPTSPATTTTGRRRGMWPWGNGGTVYFRRRVTCISHAPFKSPRRRCAAKKRRCGCTR